VTTEQEIISFIESELLRGKALRVDPLASGMIDSLATETLIAWLEETRELSFQDEDFAAHNFASIAALAALVDAKQAAGTRS